MANTKKGTIEKIIVEHRQLDQLLREDLMETHIPDELAEELYEKLSEGEIDPLQYAKEVEIATLWSLQSSYEWELSKLEFECKKNDIELYEFYRARVRIRKLESLLDYIPFLLKKREDDPVQFFATQKIYALRKLGLFDSAIFKKISVQKDQAKLLSLILGHDLSTMEKSIKSTRTKGSTVQRHRLEEIDNILGEFLHE